MLDERESFRDHRLPPGRHGLSREEVVESQRWRLLGAVAEELAESGHVRTTSTRVARRAGELPRRRNSHMAPGGTPIISRSSSGANRRVHRPGWGIRT